VGNYLDKSLRYVLQCCVLQRYFPRRRAGQSHLLACCAMVMAMMGAVSQASEPAAGTLLVFGDSLSAGYGLKPGEEWPALLQQRLAAQGSTIIVSNASISGETTSGGLARLPATLAAVKPRWVIFELGANDGLRGYPIATSRSNLAAMIKLAQQASAHVMLIGMYIPPNYGKPYTDAFARQFTELAAEYKTVLVPFLLEPVILKDELMQSDGLHPKAGAQPLILDSLWLKIQTLTGSR
jgi:acyl-CoA thioesterase I